MSFSFRNVFSPDDGESNDGPANPFSPGDSSGDISRSGSASSVGKRDEKRSFQVSELLALIPPAIAASSGVPIDEEIELPISAPGSNDVRLSLLYQVCPQLFAAEITPLNDSTITLPGHTEEETKPEVSAEFPAAESVPGFAHATKQPAPASETNPFWSQAQATVEMKEKDTGSRREETQSGGEPTPFSGTGATETPPANPFSGGGMKRGDVEKVPGGFDSPGLESEDGTPFEWPPEPAPDPSAEAVAPEAEPAAIPEENPFTSSEGFSTLFAKKAKDDEDLPFPGTKGDPPSGETENKSPIEEQAEEGVWGAMFAPPEEVSASKEEVSEGFSGFGSMIQQSVPETKEAAPSETTEETDLPVAAETFVEEPIELEEEEVEFEGFSPPVEESGAELQPVAAPAVPDPVEEVESVKPEPLERSKKPSVTGFEVSASIGPLHGETKLETPRREVKEPVTTEKNDFSSPSWLQEPDSQSELPVEEEEEQKTEEQELLPAVDSAESSDSQPSVPLYRDGDDPDLVLKAIFSTDEPFTFSKLARKIVGLDGVNGCALATPAKLVQASTSERSRVGDHARDMISTIRNLATFTGLADARFFTLQTDKGIVSLFLEGNCCLTVHQDSADFGPGIREKLILITRCLQALKE